jgi:arylformamidase
MKFHDVSVLISEDLPVWPGDPGISMTLASSLDKGNDANVTRLAMGVHTGTHIDAPFHFESNGKSIDQLPIDALIGSCQVFDLPGIKGGIGPNDLKKLNFQGAARILFKTRNSIWWKTDERKFQKDFVYITEEGASFLIDQGVKLVGIDYLSVEKFESSDYATHHLLLRNQVVIIEGLNLSDISSGEYELIALPLRLKGADGSPARVILRELEVKG